MFDILFENEDFIAVNKPEGLASIPEGVRGRDNLLSLLASIFPGKLYVVHRLDKETSGVILFAKNAPAHKYLNQQFDARRVKKTYLALCHGIIDEDEGQIDKPLREFGSGRMAVDLQRGKASLTRFRVIERLPAHTLVHAYPLTGRRHQIRAHFYSMGHPIVGDLRYGDREIQQGFPRLMLHAQEIAFRLSAGEDITIHAPTPESFNAVIAALRSAKPQRESPQ